MEHEQQEDQGVILRVRISSHLNARINHACFLADKDTWVIATLEAAVDRCLHQEKELKDIPVIPATEKYQMDFRRTFNPDYRPKDKDETSTIPVTEGNLMDLHRRMTKLEHAVNQIADKCSSIEARAKVSRTNTFKIANEVSKITEGK